MLTPTSNGLSNNQVRRLGTGVWLPSDAEKAGGAKVTDPGSKSLGEAVPRV
jgi:hypothetical protein